MKAVILGLLLLLAAGFVVAMWFLDFAIWYEHTYMYLPPLAWGVKFTKGDAVNIAYWWMIIVFVSSCVLAYLYGRMEAEKR